MYMIRLRRQQQQGVGLVEILVAVVIMAVGFLAAAQMQVNGMRYSQSAYFESQAYFMAGEMIARMRGNVAGVKSGAYDDMITATGLADPGCDAALCSPAQIAAQDRYDWSQKLYAASTETGFMPLLPSSSTVVAAGQVSKLATGQYSVSIVWADEHDSADGKSTLRVDLITEN